MTPQVIGECVLVEVDEKVENFLVANWGQVKRSWDYNVRGTRSLSARVPERAPEDAQRTWRGPANLRGALLRGFMQASGN